MRGQHYRVVTVQRECDSSKKTQKSIYSLVYPYDKSEVMFHLAFAILLFSRLVPVCRPPDQLGPESVDQAGRRVLYGTAMAAEA